MPFIAQEHAFHSIKAMLLCDKLNAFISRGDAVRLLQPHKPLAISKLQKWLILAVFRTKFGFAGEEGQNEPGFFPFPGGFKL